MLRLIGLKLAHMVPVMFIVSLATFFMVELIPGDAALTIAGPQASQEYLQQIRHDLGLDRPVVERYGSWLGDTLTGDFGRSLGETRLPVSEMLGQRFPVTLELAAVVMLLALAISIPLALISANRPNAAPDRLITAGAFGAISTPSFLVALLLIYFAIFHRDVTRWTILVVGVAAIAYYADVARRRVKRYPAGPHRMAVVRRNAALVAVSAALVAAAFVWLPSFPRQGFSRLTAEAGLRENLRTLMLPALALALTEAAQFTRLLRADLITTLQEDYVLAARAKGMPRWRVMVGDALRPSLFSLITVAGVALGRALGGTIIVETIFNLPGIGTMMVTAINGKDIPVVQATVLLLAVFYVLVNAGVDIAYGYLDPRVRRGRR